MKSAITPGIASAIERPVHRGVCRPFGGGRRKTLPRNGLLIYLARPNSDAYITAEDAEIPEDQYDWGYVLPAALFADLGEGLFFTAGGEPIVVLASEILADPKTNAWNILFEMKDETKQTGRLAIYKNDVSSITLNKARAVLGVKLGPELWANAFMVWDSGGSAGAYDPLTGELVNSATGAAEYRPTFIGPSYSVPPFSGPTSYLVHMRLRGNLEKIYGVSLNSGSSALTLDNGAITGADIVESGGVVDYIATVSSEAVALTFYCDGTSTWDGLFIDELSFRKVEG